MPETTPLNPLAPWVELATTTADWDAATPHELDTMYAQLNIIRSFEEEVLVLAGQKLINGPAHSSIGQEAGAVGSGLPLNAGDQVNGSHRGHHQFLAKALGFVAPDGIDPAQPLGAAVREVLHRSMAEIAGLADGYCHGRGGSMHLQWKEAGAMGTNAIVGGAVPFATGFAWADRHADTDNVAVTYFGDGAVNIGSVLESFNLAAAWNLPVCFFIENNQYAVSTTVQEATGEARLSGRGLGFGIPSWRVDGQDVLAVKLAMEQAVAHMRAGGGPTIVEADTYRYFHQNGPFPGSAFGYRDKDEETHWRDRDPIALVESHLVRRNLRTIDELSAIRSAIRAELATIGAGLIEQDPQGKPGQNRIRPELWPDPARIDVGIRGDLTTLEGRTVREEKDFGADEVGDQKFVDVIAEVMGRRMDADPSIVVMGEDVHKLSGGSRGATKGLAEKFEDRVLGTPISEAAFTGLGGGLALDGRFYPVVELMYADFIWVAADQLFNQIGKARHMFGGDHDMPLLLRIKIGTGTGYGSQHSMDPAGILATSVGWRIIAPSSPLEYVGLLNAAMALKDPVAVLEHDADLYKSVGPAPLRDFDFILPPGRAAIRRIGAAVTVLSYLSMVNKSVAAADSSGIDAEVVDLRWLDRASIDWDTIEASIKKTNRVLIVEQGSLQTSYGGWLADEIQRRYFDWLDAPIERVHGSESSPSISKVLEAAALADEADIVVGLRRVTA
ncbi:2-oxoisovalerate dehydrogenase E1 component [Branchiibius hedensis]|uniref:dihydrolipoyllysine-residue succinyltransferase n=1 Tax=Branchiibius hedensis TaxID=672460 RepID=A0A2Y8ZWJ3_9MICO|nr:alpha-ketoacid dehydrogenase subunit alpha/beta [Branchiibius hedensis]PWJ25444.1 2-oxoisovalerate dehydrogenase E1 component [Branchiibius hedensis]SSA34257.1 2-oxoisovalerate dehydrogenase E1 component [Branchiibius hedensis]